MKYQALYSPKQFFTLDGVNYKALYGYFETTDDKVIKYLEDHFAWKCLSEKAEVTKPIKKKKGIK